MKSKEDLLKQQEAQMREQQEQMAALQRQLELMRMSQMSQNNYGGRAESVQISNPLPGSFPMEGVMDRSASVAVN